MYIYSSSVYFLYIWSIDCRFSISPNFKLPATTRSWGLQLPVHSRNGFRSLELRPQPCSSPAICYSLRHCYHLPHLHRLSPPRVAFLATCCWRWLYVPGAFPRLSTPKTSQFNLIPIVNSRKRWLCCPLLGKQR